MNFTNTGSGSSDACRNSSYSKKGPAKSRGAGKAKRKETAKQNCRFKTF